jgi:outer membrane lipopolysaccharide assembly protein LptE/RlpB
MNNAKLLTALLLTGLSLMLGGCSFQWQLNQASIPADARTVSIPLFPNVASMVNPSLSATLADAFQQRFANQTKLMQVREDGDLAFTGEIVGYVSTPTAVTSANEYAAARQRLTITVRVSFTNRLDPQWNFENRTFSQYADYDSNQQLQTVEPSLVPEIVDALVTDIFNAAVANW